MWNELGIVSKYLGRFDVAERYYRLALKHACRSRNSPEREALIADLYHNLGGVEHSRQHFGRAEQYATKGIRMRLNSRCPDPVAIAMDHAALAAILEGQRRYAEAKRLNWQALRTYRREYGRSHPELAVALNNLGAIFQATGSPKTAERYYRAALRMKRRELGSHHPDVATTINNLGMLHVSQCRYVAARKCFQKALEILDRSLGGAHPNTVSVRANLRRLLSEESE